MEIWTLPPPSLGHTERSRLLRTVALCFLAFTVTTIYNNHFSSSTTFGGQSHGLVRKNATKSVNLFGITTKFVLDPQEEEEEVNLSGITTKFVLDPQEEEDFSPKIVWLMSFPNSGTSYTLATTALVSNMSVATNYGKEVTGDGETSVSIYPQYQEGPFWTGRSSEKQNTNAHKKLPEAYVLTKTHCGSRCGNCSPAHYIETPESFVRACSSGQAGYEGRSTRDVWYPPQGRVYKAVHLIRNPFHNVIARFNFNRHRNLQSKSNESTAKHPDGPEEFQKWCHDMDYRFVKQEIKAFGKGELMYAMMRAPCHGEFFRYVQWHNLAFETTQSLDLPVLVLHYEDYENDFNSTVTSLMDFLELPKVGKPKEFAPRHDYDDYFTVSQRRNVTKLIRKLASNETWEQIERYLFPV